VRIDDEGLVDRMRQMVINYRTELKVAQDDAANEVHYRISLYQSHTMPCHVMS
jgi:hypothetical protein